MAISRAAREFEAIWHDGVALQRCGSILLWCEFRDSSRSIRPNSVGRCYGYPVRNDIPMVFVVDDDPSVRGSLELLIRSQGWDVESFASAEKFLSRTRVPSRAALCSTSRCLISTAWSFRTRSRQIVSKCRSSSRFYAGRSAYANPYPLQHDL